jgi:hypothetical protein
MRIKRGISKAVLEAVESRLLCSNTPPVFPLGISQVAVYDGTQLVVTAPAAYNNISISQLSNGILVSAGRMGTKVVTGTFSSIKIIGGSGGDSIFINPNVTTNCLIYGNGNCVIDDQGKGNDEIWAGTGSSYTVLGSGTDTVVTLGAASATVLGGTGFDSFWMDASPAEVLKNVTTAETTGGNVHRISSYLESGANLGPTTVTISGTVYTIYTPPTGSTAATNPAASGTYTYYTGNPLFSDSGPAANDIYQGLIVNDCYFMATLAATAATDPNHIRQSICDLGDGTYAVQFTNGSGAIEYVRVTGDLPTSGGSPAYAGLGAQGSLWVALMEKAYAVVHTGAESYSSLSGGEPGGSLEDIGATSVWGLQSVTSATQLLTQMSSDLASGAAVTYTMNGHVYTVDSVNLTTDEVYLRNPYGTYTSLTASQAFADFQGEAAGAI